LKSRPRPVAPARDRNVAAARDRNAPPAHPAWWRHPALGSALVSLLFYLPTVRYGFVRDDHDLFATNPFMRNPGQLLHLLTSDFWSSTDAASGLWRPLITLSYWVDGRLAGWSPVWFHLVNVLSHAAATAALALLMVEVGVGRGAVWIATIWFALMTAHVEPVAWISGRTDVWCAAFGLAALWLHERGARGATPIWGFRIAGAVAFALALLSKETAAILVLPLAALAWARLGRREDRRAGLALEVAPWIALVVGWAVAHAALAPGAMATTPGWANPTAGEKLWTSIAALPSQLAFLLPGFPHGPDWWISPARSLADWRVAAGVALHLGALALVIRGLATRARVSAATLILWLPIVLVSAVVLLRGVLVQGERNFYLPSAGAAWLVGAGGVALWRRGLKPSTLPRAILPIGYAVMLAVAIPQSMIQMAGWRSEELMYRAMIRAQPNRADGHLGLALVMIGMRKDAVAMRALEHAEAIDSTRYEIGTYRAAVASRRHDWSEVIRWSRNAIRRGATESDPWLMEINALQQMNLLPWSRTLVETLMTHHKNDPDVAAAFARQMLAEGLPSRAIKPLRYAVDWNPDDPSLRISLGDAYMRVQHYEEAREEFRRAVGLDPGDVDAWLRLAAAFHYLEQADLRDEAISNAASLPGADQERIRVMYQRMLTDIPLAVSPDSSDRLRPDGPPAPK
jgi:tetratricopeptide (TPR) repeat protein